MRAARGLALDQLHHHIARFDIEQRADIRMVQRGDGAGFVLGAGAPIPPAPMGGEDFRRPELVARESVVCAVYPEAIG